MDLTEICYTYNISYNYIFLYGRKMVRFSYDYKGILINASSVNLCKKDEFGFSKGCFLSKGERASYGSSYSRVSYCSRPPTPAEKLEYQRKGEKIPDFSKPDLSHCAILIYGADAMRVGLRRQELLKSLVGAKAEEEKIEIKETVKETIKIEVDKTDSTDGDA
jgi:hypothetical protein